VDRGHGKRGRALPWKKAHEWEYHVSRITEENITALERNLHEMGRDGWELVQVIKGTHHVHFAAIFKRPVIPYEP
jgi:hypothetical protein